LAAAALAAAAFIAWVAWQSSALAVERVTITLPQLPAEFDGFTIAHISDIHGRRIDPRGFLVETVRAAGVDMIAATGDFVDGRAQEMDAVVPLLAALADVAPVYAVSGNHDHWAGWGQVAASLTSAGAVVLDNANVILARGGASIMLAGVADPATRRADLMAAVPAAPPDVVILLAHAAHLHEEYARLYGRGGRATAVEEPRLTGAGLHRLELVSLTLAGHTHGGQIKLPLVGALSNASGRAFPREYVEGLTWEGHGWLYINRGLGYTILPLRLLSRPELTLITLRRGQ
jgi:predicted MPP superfamily phosphohydrolase